MFTDPAFVPLLEGIASQCPGVKGYIDYYHDYLQGQIGNPKGEEKPNKGYYDPRKWIRAGEESMRDRVIKAFEELNCIDRF